MAAYAGQSVLDRVLKLKEKAFTLDRQSKEMTMVFTNVVKLSDPDFVAAGMGAFYDRYMSMVISVITAADGSVDTLLGYGVSSYWSEEGHAEAACTCAETLVASLEDMNQENKSLGLPTVTIRIGVHTGIVSQGNYGSRERLKFSILGDAVNLASSVCGLANSYYKYPILLTEPTKQNISQRFAPTAVEAIQVKGLEEPVMLYGLLGSNTAVNTDAAR